MEVFSEEVTRRFTYLLVTGVATVEETTDTSTIATVTPDLPTFLKDGLGSASKSVGHLLALGLLQLTTSSRLTSFPELTSSLGGVSVLSLPPLSCVLHRGSE